MADRFSTASQCASAVAVLMLLLAAGCSTARRMQAVDERATGMLAAAQTAEFGPNQREDLDLDAYEHFVSSSPGTTLHLNLRQALKLGANHSRDYQTARENLYTAALAVVAAAHDWDWLPRNALRATVGRDLAVPDTPFDTDASLSLTKRFYSGARLTGSLAFSSLRYLSGDHNVSLYTLADLTITQPLLRDAGPLVNREPLTQAERNLIYSLRAYVRQRKQLVIDIADAYYEVLSSRDRLEIAEQNYENLRASRERSEAMAESGRVPLFQVDQARQQELAAQSSVINREEQYQARKDDLKRLLGLPLHVTIEADSGDLQRLAEADLPEPPLDFEEASAYALDHRLDFATTNDRLADAARHAKIARNDIRAVLDLTVGATATSPVDDHLRPIEFDNSNTFVGVDAELPLDRTDELIGYRRALIREDQARRDVSEHHDRIIAELRSIWRTLRAAEQNYRIEKVSVSLAKRRVESTELLFQAGRINIRELLESQDALIRARNSLTVAMVQHRMSWLRMLFMLERLHVDPDTLWSPALDVSPDTDG